MAIVPLASVGDSRLPAGPLHLAIGMFDGVHIGHQAVIVPAVARARTVPGGVSAVLTFRPHPSVLFRPEDPTRLILGVDSQAERLEALGVDAMIVEPFTREFAAIPAERFVAWLKERMPGLRAIHVGRNFRFGAGRKGDADLLVASAKAAGVDASCVSPVEVDGQPVNSTRIRSLIASGEIESANRLLGYDYFARGPVVPGKGIGRAIGFPTLNVGWTPDLKPRLGVYAVKVGGARGVANYGVRPTVERAPAEPVLEIHLLDDCPFSTGDRITAEFVAFLRPERKFASVQALQSQIALDAAAAKARLFAGRTARQ